MVFENEVLNGFWISRYIALFEIHASAREVSRKCVARRSTRLGEYNYSLHTEYLTIRVVEKAQKNYRKLSV